MLEHAFRFVDRVVFVVGENNIRSQKALAKIDASFLKKAQFRSRMEPSEQTLSLSSPQSHMARLSPVRSIKRPC